MPDELNRKPNANDELGRGADDVRDRMDEDEDFEDVDEDTSDEEDEDEGEDLEA